MKVKFDLRREIKIAAALAVVLAIIAFTERRHADVALTDVSVHIRNSENNHFLDEADVLGLMDLNVRNLRGVSTGEMNLRSIEKKIRKDPFIDRAELYTDLKGNLVARVELKRPVARIIRNDGPDGYIAEDGSLMPVSDKFTARVMLISGPYVRKLLQLQDLKKHEEGKKLLELIVRIREDEFWNAQIAQMDIDHKGRVTILPQIGDERIEFGAPDNIEVKLSKLKIFYKEILPKTGWNKYRRMNLEFEGQIVAE